VGGCTEWRYGKNEGALQRGVSQETKVKIAERAFLGDFRKTWKYHHKLEPEQLGLADKIADVKSVGLLPRWRL